MNSICIIVNKYPNPIEPNVLVFVQQLVWTLADQGIKCSIICPVPVNLDLRYSRFPFARTEKTENGRTVMIYHPRYIGFGQTHRVLGVRTALLTTYIFSRVIIKAISKLQTKPDALYGHFLVPAGIATARAGRSCDIPAFVAYGEATYKTINEFGAKKLACELKSIAGIIAVSTENKERLLSTNVVDDQRIAIFPNGYRPERFYPRDKVESRMKFGFPAEAFIIGMVGSFDERKGVLRIEKAVDGLDGVLFACAGTGYCMPQSVKCIYRKPVSNDEIPYFLSALDAFVLPTLHEGCSNAIVEAMAIGLPIISSNRAFNYDILDVTNSIMIEPEDIVAIRSAIIKLRDNQTIRKQLAAGSLKKAEELTLAKRAEKIVEYILNKADI